MLHVFFIFRTSPARKLALFDFLDAFFDALTLVARRTRTSAEKRLDLAQVKLCVREHVCVYVCVRMCVSLLFSTAVLGSVPASFSDLCIGKPIILKSAAFTVGRSTVPGARATPGGCYVLLYMRYMAVFVDE